MQSQILILIKQISKRKLLILNHIYFLRLALIEFDNNQFIKNNFWF